MVKGLDIFRERLRPHAGAFTMIGGAACDQWFTAQNIPFRATKDLDIVMMIDVIDQAFVGALRAFIAEGGYRIAERTEGTPVLYRFGEPNREDFPFMLELFSRRPESLELNSEQTIIPIRLEPDHHSLSAILLDDAYYGLIQTHYDQRDGLRMANATALIPLKSRAWLDLSRRKAAGESIDNKNISKHRNDVFRLAATLPGEAGPQLPRSIVDDLVTFVRSFPADSPDWPKILASLKESFGGGLQATALLDALHTYFQLPNAKAA